MARRVRGVADVVLLVGSVTAAAFLLVRLLAPGSAAPRPVYEPNERLAHPLPIALQPVERALVIALDSRCVYCTKSMAFYKKVQEARRPRTKIVVVGKEQESVLRAYVEQHAWKPDVVASVPRNYLKSSLTPFVLLVSADGLVLDSWPGFLDDTRERQVLRAITQTRAQ